MRRQNSLYFIVIGVFLLLISGSFLSEGLSRVGTDNAVVSQRMSEGFENFWLPSLNTPGNPDRSSYLPLGYWIESKWFSLFPYNSFLVEKLYSVLIFIILGFLILWIWKLMGNSRSSGWLPLMCWMTIPIVSWSATNNLLEGTMTIFVLLSVVFMFKGSKAMYVARARAVTGKDLGHNRFGRTGWFALAALMMEMAFLVKGFMGLFPVFFPILYCLIVHREKIMYPLYETAVIVVVWLATFGLVAIVSPEVTNHLFNYIHHQMIGGVLHVHTVASHFYIIYVLILQSLIPIAIILILSLMRYKKRPATRFLFFWRHKKKLTAEQIERSRMGWFFLALGLSGVLPIMVGLKQQQFYLVPTFPFFAMAMACLIFELLEDWLEGMTLTAHRVLIGIAVLLFGTGVILNLASIHKVNSNQALLSDMKVILPCLEKGEVVTVSPDLLATPEVEEFFYRYKGITFDTLWQGSHLLTHYGKMNCTLEGVRVTKCDLPTAQYILWEIEKEDM